MIDIHAHFLPTIDDGAVDIEMSIQMLADSVSQGVDICVATPHCVIHRQENISSFLEKRAHSFHILKEEIEKRNAPAPKILLGAEVMLDNDLNAYSGIERLCIEGTPYMMFEFGAARDIRTYADWLYSLTLKGIKPVIAHIDRYMNYEMLIRELKGIDIIYQVNASRFLSIWGRRIIKNLMQYNNTYIVSSDMHNTSMRQCNMQPAYSKAFKKYQSEADNLFERNAKKIIGIQND